MNQLDLTCPSCAKALAAYERWLGGGPAPQLLWGVGLPGLGASHCHLSELGGMILASEVARLMSRAAVQAAAGRNFAEGLAQGTRYLQEELGKAYDAGVEEGERRASPGGPPATEGAETEQAASAGLPGTKTGEPERDERGAPVAPADVDFMAALKASLAKGEDL